MKPLFLPSMSLLALSLLLLSSPAAQQTKDIFVTSKIQKDLSLGDRYALIIGIGKYKDKRIPVLNYTVSDAKAMFDVLTDPRHGRFPKAKARLLLDEGASRDAIMKGFTWLRQNVKAEDTVIIFYSGHGAPEEENTYWVPYDANIDDLFATAVGNDIITGQLSQIRAKRLITFLDSCYSKAIVEKKDKPKASLFDQDFFAKYRGEGRVTITASDAKELSLESEDLKQGVFTHYLVEALKGKADRNQDGAVELEEVWEHVKQKVTDEAQKRGNKQRPNLIGQMTAGLLVSLNPGVLETEKVRLEGLTRLLTKGEIRGTEYEEAKKVLEGEGDARLLDVVRGLADGRLRPSDYRLARAGALALKAEEKPAVKPPETPAGKPPEVKDEKVVALLDRASAQMKLKKFTSPKGDNAHETLKGVLEIHPGHPEALRLLGEIAEAYKGWGERAYREGRFQDARTWYERAKGLTPEDPLIQSRLSEIEGKLTGAEAERERRAREERERLARLEQERRGREERERLARLEEERRRLAEERARLEEERERRLLEERERRLREEREREARLERERELKRVEGVWSETRRADTSELTHTVAFRVEGTAIRGVYERFMSFTVKLSRLFSSEDRTCREKVRFPFQGRVLEGGVVNFTTSPGEIMENNCNLPMDDLREPGSFQGQLSADGFSLTLNVMGHGRHGGGLLTLRKTR